MDGTGPWLGGMGSMVFLHLPLNAQEEKRFDQEILTVLVMTTSLSHIADEKFRTALAPSCFDQILVSNIVRSLGL
jgi:hypothetical protein